jgi:hypothetical protein
MPSHSVPLVGMHFRPPAKAILQVLPSGCPLQVVPEPDNPYDANALAVMVATGDIPPLAHEDLAGIAAPFGFDLPSILVEPVWHLGYVKATEALWLQPKIIARLDADDKAKDDAAPGYMLIETFPGKLSFDSAGKPLVVVEL